VIIKSGRTAATQIAGCTTTRTRSTYGSVRIKQDEPSYELNTRSLALNYRPAFSKYLNLSSGDKVVADKRLLLSVEEYQSLVIRLQRRLKQKEKENYAARMALTRQNRRCRIQGRLVKHLRERLRARDAEVVQYQLAEEYRRELTEQVELARRVEDSRVSSLKGAFLRISGAETNEQPESRSVYLDYAEFDDAEFLPLDDSVAVSWQAAVWQRIRVVADNWLPKFKFGREEVTQ